jgi:hypothetical protein
LGRASEFASSEELVGRLLKEGLELHEQTRPRDAEGREIGFPKVYYLQSLRRRRERALRRLQPYVELIRLGSRYFALSQAHIEVPLFLEGRFLKQRLTPEMLVNKLFTQQEEEENDVYGAIFCGVARAEKWNQDWNQVLQRLKSRGVKENLAATVDQIIQLHDKVVMPRLAVLSSKRVENVILALEVSLRSAPENRISYRM